MGGQPQAGVPAVPRGRVSDAAVETQAISGRSAPTAGASANGERSVDHGLHPGRVSQRTKVPDAEPDGWHTREALVIEVDTSLPGLRVVRVLERLRERRGTPAAIQVDNGTEFTSRVVDQWADQQGVALYFIERGKPTQNALIESFNGKFRDECLNQNWFTDLADARRLIEAWRVDYNTVRPHSSLGYRTPVEFAHRTAALRSPTAPSAPLFGPVPAWLVSEDPQGANL